MLSVTLPPQTRSRQSADLHAPGLTRRRTCSVVLAWLWAVGCIALGCTSGGGGPPAPASVLCAARAGRITGAAALEAGNGDGDLVPRDDGARWEASRGPQGGFHILLGVRTHGLGPTALVRWEYQDADGGTLRPWQQAAVCLESTSYGAQQALGMVAQMGLGPPRCSAMACGVNGFVLAVKVTDASGRQAVVYRRVAGMDFAGNPDPCERDAGVTDAGGDCAPYALNAFFVDAGPF